jgi:hypothetical protein
MHQAAPVTIAKLRWLLGKATPTLGDKRLADLSPKDVYARRLTVPEGHRFETTQALRQVRRSVDAAPRRRRVGRRRKGAAEQELREAL